MTPLLAILACVQAMPDTGATDDTAPALGAPTRPAGDIPIGADMCPGLDQPSGRITLDRSWSMLTLSGCATRVHLDCPPWVTTGGLPEEVVTGDVLLVMAGLAATDGDPRLGACTIRSAEGAVSVPLLWPG